MSSLATPAGAPRPLRLLVLGGTAWLGGEIASAALGRGHEVTCLARGSSGTVPDGAVFVGSDRSASGAYDPVIADGRRWDAVVDLSRDPSHVREAVAVLEPASASFAFVSSVSVYDDTATTGGDESAALVDADESDYGGSKVAGERAVVGAFGADRSLIVRAGLIGGPGDHTGRTGWWPLRFAGGAGASGSDPVLVPDVPGLEVQPVDVRDLATWIVVSVERGLSGTYDAVGDRQSLTDHLAAARRVSGHTGEIVPVDEAWLEAHEVNPWAGPRSMPLWVPVSTHAGFGSRSGGAGRAAGLVPRPVDETLRDVLAWELSRPGPVGPHGAGLTSADERDLLVAARDRRR
ncbi:NAD-dependent epimerase/dehydratase family protein [Frigoribacterium sp. PhB24]|uniref:NAD-dependent epimerase/dehydratase family protein n=1 Tax=Frigoribacterium sp. PhB24 TaxID=2485204 RepID=UPI000FAE700B|nr:NAD-dependent epimerase/dehydratase family protein [Frigoribacterium sp. PhB24]ROS48487.1 nucleoside-diphosphate-sugar epimerase [Frigoribacterium sp. PhB24]